MQHVSALYIGSRADDSMSTKWNALLTVMPKLIWDTIVDIDWSNVSDLSQSVADPSLKSIEHNTLARHINMSNAVTDVQ